MKKVLFLLFSLMLVLNLAASVFAATTDIVNLSEAPTQTVITTDIDHGKDVAPTCYWYYIAGNWYYICG